MNRKPRAASFRDLKFDEHYRILFKNNGGDDKDGDDRDQVQ